jgi:HlyD family secretion protein
MKKLILTLIVLAAIGGGAAAYYMRKGAPEPTVSTMQLSRGDIADTVQATGTLEAVETVDVGTQVSGVVEEMSVDFNSIVKKGQVIARLDPSIIQTQIEQARANVTRAEADLDRLRVNLADAKRKYEQAKQMWDKQLIPRDQLETAELNVKTQESQIRSSEAGLIQSKSQLNTQEVNLGHTVIRAPIDGIVISRSVDQGQTVAASMNAPVLYVLAADLTKMQVIANIDEAEIGRMRPGQPVTFRVDAYPTDTFHGSVQQVRLLPATVQNVVTYSTVISVPNAEYKLKPGMTANVTIEIARRSNVLRAPAAALRFRPTADVFAALKQEVPADLNRGMGGGNRAGQGGQGGQGGAGGRGGFNGASGAAGAPSAPPANPPAAPAAGAPQAAASQPQRRPEAQGDPGTASARQGGGDRGGDRPAGEFNRGGGRGGANMTPEQREERRKQMEQRLANMSPEERERFQARAREGGGGRGGFQRDGAAGDGGNTRGNRSQQGGTQRGQSQPVTGIAATNATSIDALFAPLPVTEGRGRVWLWTAKQLKAVNVRTGITDGTWTEILEGGEASQLQPGTEVVTNVVTGLETQARPGQQNPGSNPLMGPQRGNQQRGGAPGGGGRGR